MKKEDNPIDWNYIDNPIDGAVYLGGLISDKIEQLKDLPLLFFISGGSCFDVLPSIKLNDFQNVTVIVLDERFDQTNENNNFSQLLKNQWSEYFLKRGGDFIATNVISGENQQQLADRFKNEIESWINENRNGRMIALFGMGGDGHTAGIFPHKENPELFETLFNGSNIIASYDATGKNKFTARITTTNALFEKLEAGYAYVFGKDKHLALQDFRINEKASNELPVMLLRNVKNVKIVTDLE
jgi:6-phosphogluconolactonase/glucosamine-6-phosphate isomerase/deaminase